MLCYEALDKPGEAADVFERCRATFGAMLNIAPGAETQKLYQRICQKDQENGSLTRRNLRSI